MTVCLPVAGETAAQPVEFEMSFPRQRLPAPAFTLSDPENSPYSLDEYRGKVILLHFWATFCAPCLEEMPALETLWQRYRERGLVVLAIAADRGDSRVVSDFAVNTGVSFPVLLDPDGVVRNRYEVVALPMSYLVGRDGRFSGRIMGTRDWNGPAGREVIETLLAGGAAE
jgi:peroxiredoxin